MWNISKMVTNLVRHLDLTDRESDGAVHWKSMCPKRRRAFQSDSAQTFSDSRWLDVLLYLRANSGAHTGGELIASELMEHVARPLRWKEFLYHVGSSFNVTSILQARLIAGGKDRKERRQTVFFTPLDPFGDEAQEEFNNDSSRPRKDHFTVNGSLIKTPSIGSTWPGHNRKDCSVGRQGLAPLSFAIQCQATA